MADGETSRKQQAAAPEDGVTALFVLGKRAESEGTAGGNERRAGGLQRMTGGNGARGWWGSGREWASDRRFLTGG